MKRIETALPDVFLVEPKKFGDSRGYFFESFNQRVFDELSGSSVAFVQDNQSRSARGVLRGLHYQIRQPQGKLIRVLEGEIFDVAVDLRRDSPTFGRSACFLLSAENNLMAWIPAGFAHGFVATSETCLFHYLCSTVYDGAADANIRWNDAALAIDWPVAEPSLSEKDARAPFLEAIPEDRQPIYTP